MKRGCPIPVIALVAITLCTTLVARAQTEAYVVADATTGHILASKNSEKKAQVASLTKIATAMVVLDWAKVASGDLNASATISSAAASSSGVNPVGFVAGDRVTMRDLLYAALMQSDNIAAQALAEHVGNTLQGEGSAGDRFAAQMNALARRLGMERTLFLNPHGLDTERKVPFSTASDMTRLTKYAMADSAFRFHVSQTERRISVQHSDGTQAQYQLRNTNELLGVDAVDGVKTGMTRKAGECVIISAPRAPEAQQTGSTVTVTPRRLIVTVLGAHDRFALARKLLAQGWQEYDAWAAKGRPLEKGAQL